MWTPDEKGRLIFRSEMSENSGLKSPRRVRLEVSTQALKANFEVIKHRVAPCRVLTVLKANAYNVGARFMGGLAAAVGADRIGAADLEEALELQAASGLPIQVLGVLTPGELPTAVEHGLIVPVNALAMAEAVSAEAVRQRRTVRVHVILDTGMGRFGLLADNYRAEINAMRALPNLEMEGVYSHFPMAGTPGDPATQAQIVQFKKQLDVLNHDGITFALRHFAATDGINFQPESWRSPFNMVRLGLDWYGLCGSQTDRAIGLQPALRLTSVVGAVRELPADSTVGYFRTCRLTRKTRVATICAGYADGLPLALSNRGRVLICGVPCPILGRLSMDYTTVDVSGVPGEVGWGTPVTLWGEEGSEVIDIEEYARLKNTHVHDILCSLGSRVERVYF